MRPLASLKRLTKHQGLNPVGFPNASANIQKKNSFKQDDFIKITTSQSIRLLLSWYSEGLKEWAGQKMGTLLFNSVSETFRSSVSSSRKLNNFCLNTPQGKVKKYEKRGFQNEGSKPSGPENRKCRQFALPALKSYGFVKSGSLAVYTFSI
jgi:hypothetical protein